VATDRASSLGASTSLVNHDERADHLPDRALEEHVTSFELFITFL